jgi:FdhE protein
VAAACERRAGRAAELAGRASTAGEPLRFAAGLYRAQARAAAVADAAHAARPLSGRLMEDLDRLLGAMHDVARFAAAEAPATLAEDARSWMADDGAARDRLLEWWTGGGARPDYLARALLRPYAEVLVYLGIAPDRGRPPRQCPACGSRPWIAARRAEAGTDGIRRSLGCSLCAGEWPLGRIHCPACGEGDPQKLPSFHSDAHAAARLEACETCRRYVKSIDLTVEPAAIPEVDDVLSWSLDLWAAEQGFTRIEPGLAGV